MAQHNKIPFYPDYSPITDKFKLEPHHVFGFSRNVRSNLFFLEDQTILFPSGRFCVMYHTLKKWNKFIPVAKESQGIKALAVSPDRRFLAVSECRDQGTITVFDLQHPQFCQRKVLTSDTSMVQEFVCMAFSSDSKYLMAYSGKTERSLFYWEWQKKKLIVKKKITTLGDVSQISFHPKDNTQICVSGDRVLSIFKLCNDTLKETNFLKKEKEDILCHAWISEDQIVAGTKSGNLLLLFLKFKHVHKLRRPVPSSVTTGPGVTAITPLGNGFACSAGPDLVCLFEKTEGRDFFRKTMEIKLPEDPCLLPDKAEQQTITSMCVSPLQQTLAISTDKGQMFYINFDWRVNKQETFKHLFHTLHSGRITSLSVCSDKPLFATCSTDNTVRIWNHKTNSLVLGTQFPKQPLSVALHPTGLSILISFPEKICLMSVLVDGFRISKEFSVNSCTKCVFNHDGSKFAAVGYNRIYIFNIRDTYQKMDLRGHYKQVLSVKWSDDDARLVSCEADGVICVWNALTGACECKIKDTTCTFTDVIFMPNNGRVVAVSSDNKLKEFKDGVLLHELQLDGTAITAIAVTHCGQMIMVGTSAGTVRVIQYPLQIGNNWTEHQAHSGPITHIAITSHDRFLLTASEDGSLLIWTISDHIGHKLRVWKEIDEDEEVLCTRGYLEKRDRSLLEAKKHLELSELKRLIECGETDAQCAKKVDSIMLKHKMMFHELKTESKAHKDEAERLQARYEEAKEEHARVLEHKDRRHYRTVLEEIKKKEQLERKVMESEKNWEEKLRQIKEQHLRTMKQMKESYEIKLEEMKAKFPKTRYLTMIDNNVPLKDKELQQLKDTMSSLEHEKDLMEKKKLVQEAKLKTELVDQKRTIRRLQEDLKRAQDHHRNALTQIKDLKNRVEEHKITNSALEEEISALHTKLEGVKSSDCAALQSQIKQLRQERDQLRTSSQLKNVAQLHKRIEDFKTTIKQLKAEQLQKDRTHQEIIDGLKKKLAMKDRELCNERQKIRSMSTQLEKIKADIHKGTSFLQESKLLKDHFIRLQRHCL